MLPFPLQIQPGLPITEQLVYAVKKAVISGLLKPGNRFPSVRAVSQELRIHPNTAHKAIGVLITEGLLEVHPGIGTVVGQLPPAASAHELKLFAGQVEHLVVEAKNHRLSLAELQTLVERHWNRLTAHEPNYEPRH